MLKIDYNAFIFRYAALLCMFQLVCVVFTASIYKFFALLELVFHYLY